MKKTILFLVLSLSVFLMTGQNTNTWNGSGLNSNAYRLGNVAIGTDSFGTGTDLFKLSVNGRIRAESVKVYTDWADFVFEDDYKLPTLQEVEAYIKKNGHLENIPSAAQVAENGIDIGEMNKLLLQKVEELTLYMIGLQKEVETLRSQKQ